MSMMADLNHGTNGDGLAEVVLSGLQMISTSPCILHRLQACAGASTLLLPGSGIALISKGEDHRHTSGQCTHPPILRLLRAYAHCRNASHSVADAAVCVICLRGTTTLIGSCAIPLTMRLPCRGFTPTSWYMLRRACCSCNSRISYETSKAWLNAVVSSAPGCLFSQRSG